MKFGRPDPLDVRSSKLGFEATPARHSANQNPSLFLFLSNRQESIDLCSNSWQLIMRSEQVHSYRWQSDPMERDSDRTARKSGSQAGLMLESIRVLKKCDPRIRANHFTTKMAFRRQRPGW